jgi:hypothetical protein
VSVPLDAEIMDPTPDKDGQFHGDGNKVMRAVAAWAPIQTLSGIRNANPRSNPIQFRVPYLL